MQGRICKRWLDGLFQHSLELEKTVPCGKSPAIERKSKGAKQHMHAPETGIAEPGVCSDRGQTLGTTGVGGLLPALGWVRPPVEASLHMSPEESQGPELYAGSPRVEPAAISTVPEAQLRQSSNGACIDRRQSLGQTGDGGLLPASGWVRPSVSVLRARKS